MEEVLLFNRFFPIVVTKLCDGAEIAIFCVLYFQRAAYSTFQTCILNSL